MTLLRIDASIRTTGSASREIADVVEQEWLAARPDARVVRRHLGTEPLPATAWAAAVSSSWTPEADRTPEQLAGQALSAALVDELQAADAVLVAVPLYNFGVSQHLKTWIDLVVADPRAGAGADPVLAGKRVVLATVRGGSYAAGTPREGWDHATAYLRRIFADAWGAELTVVEREFTLVGVNPALDEFAEQAAEMQAAAVSAAREAGRALHVLPAAA